ncbi:MAG TPA: carboxypeptidase regulatory-like domain-containing protein, partial [Steroidobacteraceae bacterium]|nr:carboxypeptidase regulatory-like domain-containing protein [Steroidobacteraceae bacterium]
FLLKSAGSYNITARCEKSKQNGSVSIRTVGVLDLNFKNHAPRIDEIAERASGKGVVSVLPNTAVQLTANAKDIDGDAVEYLWRDDDGVIPTPSPNPNQLTRNAPAVDGLHTTYLMARDGYGGYTYRRFNLEVGKQVVQFAGTVVDETTRAPISGAVVELAGKTTTTNAQGFFNITDATNKDDRYVLNIRHNNYALWSQVMDRSFRGNVFELIRAQVTSQSIDTTLTVTDTGSSGWCGNGKDGRPLPVVRKSAPSEYIDQELQGKVKPLSADYLKKITADQSCTPQSAQIILPAGSLVDANGNKASGNVRVAVAGLNPTRRPLPGDLRAIDSNSQESELLSYGAVYAEFRDGSGNKLNLASGAKAKVQIPIPPAQVSTAASSIDFWSYDEKTGKWQYEGKANLISTPTGPAYLGYTTHFSVLNMDVAGNDPAVATCLRFTLDSSVQAWGNLRMRATVSYNGNQVKTKETAMNNDQYHAIYRIPYGSSFPPNTLRLEIFGTFNGQSVVLIDKVINTDARPKMTGTNLWPPYPYSECGTEVNLAPDPGNVPEYASNDATNRPYFLTGPSGGFLPDDGETVATNYYAALGVDPATYTLGNWWGDHGFNNTDGGPGTGTSYTRAAYMNFNDLGFGRDMHCAKNGSDLACYVTNYGAPDQTASNADDALNQNSARRGATVAMTYTAGSGANAVQFYVFGNNGAAATMLKFADLDGFGPKPVPHLCIVCHGGSPTLTGNVAQNSRFREFDAPSFHYAGGQTWDYGQAVPSNMDAASLGSLNHLVHDITPSTAPIYKLIDAWYGGVYTGAPALPIPPSGWNNNATEADGYHNVYGTTCRTCHIARDSGAATPPSIVFNNLVGNFDGRSYVVCGKDYRVMPNAIITYKNFWTNTPRVNQFELLMNPIITANTCKNDVVP